MEPLAFPTLSEEQLLDVIAIFTAVNSDKLKDMRAWVLNGENEEAMKAAIQYGETDSWINLMEEDICAIRRTNGN